MIQDNNFEKFVKIKVIPNAKKTEIIGKMDDGAIKIRVKAIPENGKANAEILKFFEKNFGEKFKIISGATNSRKILEKISEK